MDGRARLGRDCVGALSLRPHLASVDRCAGGCQRIAIAVAKSHSSPTAAPYLRLDAINSTRAGQVQELGAMTILRLRAARKLYATLLTSGASQAAKMASLQHVA